MGARRVLAVLSIAAACCVPLSGCSVTIDINDAVDAARDAAGEAQDAVRDAISDASAALDEARSELEQTLSGLPDQIRQELGSHAAEIGENLAQTARIEVTEAASGAAVSTIDDAEQITDLLGSLDYASWRVVDAAPSTDARYSFEFLRKPAAIISNGELRTVMTLVTYDAAPDGAPIVELVVPVVDVSVYFEVPQADVDALNGLA